MLARVEDWGYFDLASEQEVFQVRGKDVPAFLNKYLTQDVLRMPTPGAAPAAFLTQKGKIVSDALVVKLKEQTLLIFPKGFGERVKQHLRMFLDLEDISMEGSKEFVHLVLLGKNLPKKILSTLPEAKNQIADFSFEGLKGWCWDSDRFGDKGVELLLPVEARWQPSLAQAGGASLAWEELERLRIQSGLPKMGVDMGEENLVAEVGLDKRATSFTKGCYLGQETTARVNTQGHVNRKLVRLRLEKPIEGSLPLEVFQGAHAVGRLTSAVNAPEGAVTWALGMIQSKALAAEALAKEALTLCGGQVVSVVEPAAENE